MQGFETVMTPDDLRSQGWAIGTTVGVDPAFVPATRGQTGRTFHIGNRVNSTATTAWPGGSATPNAQDTYYNTGVTLASLYAAGGFAIGFAAKSNTSAAVSTPFAMGSSGAVRQMIYNPSNQTFYAIGTDNGVVSIYTSTNCQSWTRLAAQPGITLSYGSTAIALANNRIYVTASTAGATAAYTDDGGLTWNTANTVVTAGTLGIRYLNGLYWSLPSGVATATIYNSTDGITFSAITISASANVTITDMTYFNGRYLIAATGGNVYASTTGSSGAANWPIVGTGLNTPRSFATASMVGAPVVIATSTAGYISSPDGVTWTYNTIANFTTTFGGAVGYHNGQYILTGVVNGVGQGVATSTDGVSWVVSSNYWSTRTTGVTTMANIFWSNSTIGWVMSGSMTVHSLDGFSWETLWQGEASGALVATVNYSLTGIFTSLSTSNASATFVPSSITGVVQPTQAATINYKSTQSLTSATADTTTATSSFSITDTSTPWHYYELIFTANVAAVNTFDIVVTMDGLVKYTDTARAVLPAANTTHVVFINLGKQATFTEYDDIYFIDFAGTTNNVAFGDVTIQAQRPTTDVDVQFAKFPTGAASNAAAVRAGSLSQATGYVEGSLDATHDIYSSTDTVNPVFNVKAVQVEAYFNKSTSTSSTAKLGIVSSASSTDTGNFSVNSLTPVYVSKIAELNPNGNVQWTTSTVQSAEIRIDRVS